MVSAGLLSCSPGHLQNETGFSGGQVWSAFAEAATSILRFFNSSHDLPANHLLGSQARSFVCVQHGQFKEARKPCEAGIVPATPKTLCTVAPRIGNGDLKVIHTFTSLRPYVHLHGFGRNPLLRWSHTRQAGSIRNKPCMAQRP